MKVWFRTAACEAPPPRDAPPKRSDAPAMLPLNLNAFYVDKELLVKSGYKTVRDLYNEGIRNQHDLQQLCIRLKKEKQKEEKLRQLSDLGMGAAIVVATSFAVYAYGRRASAHKDLQALLLRTAAKHRRAAPLLKGVPYATSALDGALRLRQASGVTAFEAPGARGHLRFSANHTGSQWVVDALTLQLSEVLDAKSGYFVPTDRSFQLLPEEDPLSSGTPSAAASAQQYNEKNE